MHRVESVYEESTYTSRKHEPDVAIHVYDTHKRSLVVGRSGSLRPLHFRGHMRHQPRHRHQSHQQLDATLRGAGENSNKIKHMEKNPVPNHIATTFSYDWFICLYKRICDLIGSQPGSNLAYSNTGFSVLGRLLERVRWRDVRDVELMHCHWLIHSKA